MKAGVLVRSISRKLKRLGLESAKPDEVLLELEEVLNGFTKEPFSWSRIHTNPLFKTSTGVREYALPKHFGQFVRGADSGFRPLVKLSDGSSEIFLERSPDLLDRDLASASNGKPTRFVVTRRNDVSSLWLDPAPDNNGGSHYTGRGVWYPLWTSLEENSDVVMPRPNCLILGTVLRFVENQTVRLEFNEERRALFMDEARYMEPSLAPAMGEGVGVEDFSMMRGMET